VATEPLIDLFISKIIPSHCFTRCSSNKAVSLLLKHYHPSSVAVIFQSWCTNRVSPPSPWRLTFS